MLHPLLIMFIGLIWILLGGSFAFEIFTLEQRYPPQRLVTIILFRIIRTLSGVLILLGALTIFIAIFK